MVLAGDERHVASRVARAVADVRDVEPTDLPPLRDAVGVDALDGPVRSGGGEGPVRSVAFAFASRHVAVDGRRAVRVGRAAATDVATDGRTSHGSAGSSRSHVGSSTVTVSASDSPAASAATRPRSTSAAAASAPTAIVRSST